ncbi:MAG TPA: ABC transporter permease subunit [Roseiflexaceae bacterium]|nr:ABC transporter permease subunit [Roseiflexaceae bacterium]
MAKRVTTGAAPTMVRSEPMRRSKRVEAILGRDWKVALPFILPLVILMAGLIFWPFINAILLSFTTRSIARTEQWVGLANYVRLFRDADYRNAVNNTFLFTVASVSIKLVVGMTIALLLNSKLPFRNVLTGIMLLPWIVPEVVTAMAWRSIYDPLFGGLNPILQALGLIDRRVAWLAEPDKALASVIAVNVWKGIPFFTMLLLAGLKAIDRELYEAAEVDGASAAERFRNITLPGLKYVIAVTVLLSTITTFNTFGLVYLMTGGGPGGTTRLYSILAYERAIFALRFGPGAAVALSMAPVLAIFILVLARFMRRDLTARENETRVDRIFGKVGNAIGWLFELILLPFMALAEVIGRIGTSIVRGANRARRERTGVVLRMLLLLPLVLFVVFPFYWIIITSFKTDLQIQQFQSIYWPSPWTLEQYRTLLFETPYLTWFRNTLIVATTSTFIAVGLAALAGYALARLKFLGASSLTTVLLITYLLPGALLFIPLYRILTNLGIINTHLSLIVTYPTFLMPFATWVMLGYYRSIPEDLEDAAMIDGSTRLGAFWRVTLPLAAPALLSVLLFAFTNAWNEFLFAYVFITSETLKTLPVGLQLLVFGDILPWGMLMGASLLMAIPVMTVYIYAQRFLVEGLTAGSVKG